MSGTTSAMADMERHRKEQQILAATHHQFGEIPLDEKYLPVMSAFIDCRLAEETDRLLMDLLHEATKGDAAQAIISRINHNRRKSAEAFRRYAELTDPFNKDSPS